MDIQEIYLYFRLERVSMSIDFKTKRIEYLNNWPNVEPFEIEQKYYDLVGKKKVAQFFLRFNYLRIMMYPIIKRFRL